jgi:hypothetical protein
MDEIYPIVDEIYSRGDIQRLTSNANSATVLGSNPASSDTVESEAEDEAVLNKVLYRRNKNLPLKDEEKLRRYENPV